MLTHIKNISKDTIIYGIGSSLSSLVTFALIPLYGHFFSPSEYGYLTLIVTFQTILEITILFGFNTGFFRYYIMADTDDQKKTVYSTSYVLVLLMGSIVFLWVFIFDKQLSDFLLGNEGQNKLVYFATLTALLNSFMTIGFSFMRSERKTVLFGTFQLAKVILIGSLNILFVAVYAFKYEGVIWSNLISSFCMAIIFFLFFNDKFNFKFSYHTAKKILLFSAPIFAGNITYYSLGFADRFFLNSYTTKEELGIYSLGVKIASIINAGLVAPFSTAVVPYALSLAKESTFESIYQNIIKYFVSVLFSVSILLMVFAKEIISFTSSSDYSMAWMIVGPIIISNIFYALFYNFTIVLDIKEKTIYGLFIIGVSSLISLIMNFILIKYYGIQGAILTNIIANFTLLLISYFICQRVMKINYPVHSFLKLIVIYLVCTSTVYWFNSTCLFSIFLNYSFKILFSVIVIPFSLFASEIIGKKEIDFVLNYIKGNNKSK